MPSDIKTAVKDFKSQKIRELESNRNRLLIDRELAAEQRDENKLIAAELTLRRIDQSLSKYGK